jgi:hypothetical protein
MQWQCNTGRIRTTVLAIMVNSPWASEHWATSKGWHMAAYAPQKRGAVSAGLSCFFGSEIWEYTVHMVRSPSISFQHI